MLCKQANLHFFENRLSLQATCSKEEKNCAAIHIHLYLDFRRCHMNSFHAMSKKDNKLLGKELVLGLFFVLGKMKDSGE